MKITSEIKRNVITIDEQSTTSEAAILMTNKQIGALVVTGAAGIIGLFTERDLMTRVVAKQKDPVDITLKDVISGKVVRVGPEETCEHGLDLMKENHCRHLLVFENDEFVGVISLRDIVALMSGEREDMISRLQEYISG